MRCRICGAEIRPDQARCWRCQCRLAEAAPGPDYVHGAAAPQPAIDEAPAAPPRFTVTAGGGAVRGRPAIQPPLFPSDSKLVGLDDYLALKAPRPRAAAPRRARPSTLRELPGQISFDFEAARPGACSPAAGSRQRIAGLGRRSLACVVDLALAFALGVLPFFAAVRTVLASSWPGSPGMYAALSASVWLIVTLYHLLFAFAGRPTPGQRFARLKLVTMEGRPGEPAHRVWRVIFNVFPPACLLGSAWAALTEESFSWADQVSGTYFTAADARRHARAAGAPEANIP